MNIIEAKNIVKINGHTIQPFHRIQEFLGERFKQHFIDQNSIYGDLSLLCWDLVELQQEIYSDLLQEATLSGKISKFITRILYDLNLIDNRVQTEEIFSDEEIRWSNPILIKLVGHIDHTKKAYNLLLKNDPKPKNDFSELEKYIEEFKKTLLKYKKLDVRLYSFSEAEIEWNKLTEKEKGKIIIDWETGIDKNCPNQLVD
jgi:hypothetical protein